MRRSKESWLTMPLKHDTETVMMFFLGLAIALTGAIITFLPPLSVSMLPWGAAFALTVVYPLALYPMMKDRRADYEFRVLHFVPALMLFVWLLLDVLAAFRPSFQVLQSLYTWSWSAPLVICAFLLLMLFCVRVIRQRVSRLGLLTAVLGLFLIFSQVSETFSWDSRLAQRMWPYADTGTGLIADVGGTSSNLSPSTDSEEEQWRAALRRMERRRRELRDGQASAPASADSSSAASAIIASVGSQQSSTPVDDKTPPHLPSSGMGPEGLALLLAAGYCTVLQRRMIRRG